MYREVAELENLQNGFSAFVGLMNSVVSYRKIRRKGENIYVQKEYEVKARYILDRITEIVETRYSRDTKFSVASIVDNDEISIAIAKSLLSSIFSIVVDEEGCFEVKQRRIDVSMEIIEILCFYSKYDIIKLIILTKFSFSLKISIRSINMKILRK